MQKIVFFAFLIPKNLMFPLSQNHVSSSQMIPSLWAYKNCQKSLFYQVKKYTIYQRY